DFAGLALERLEVAELIEPLYAELERFGVEDAALEETDLAADDVVARRRVAGERDAVDEELLPFLHPHRHVDERRAVGVLLPGVSGLRCAQRLGRFRLVRIRIVVELVVGEAGELVVAAGAVHLARFLEALADALLAVP